jgi:hypothetical protein
MTKHVEAYPLTWPMGRERTLDHFRKDSIFSGSFDRIRRGLCDELDRLGARRVIISTNLPLRADGMPRGGVQAPADPGVAVYFTWKDRDMCISCDKYNRIWENMRAIQKTIEALRGIERWGTADMMERTFHGFTALPEKAGQHWREYFEIPDGVPVTKEHIEKAFRSYAHIYHPDRGGTIEEFETLKLNRANALKDIEAA